LATPTLVRFRHGGTIRIGVQIDDSIYDVTHQYATIAEFLKASVGRVDAAIGELVAAATQGAPYAQTKQLAPTDWLAPVDSQDIWAAGVTYERSREARQEEAQDGGDVYARVYRAERPELFFKGHGTRVVGNWSEVGIRSDSRWNVPEPELALLINPALEVVGISIGNDMSSRDIEGSNPLYLPQAKIYNASCALGPCIVLGAYWVWPMTTIRLEIERQGTVIFASQVETSSIHRTMEVLLSYLGRCNEFPDGVVLLTGTGIVPPAEITLAVGDVVRISIGGIGTLTNTVKQV